MSRQPEMLARYRRELLENPDLVERILSDPASFPLVLEEPEAVTVRVTRADADRGIARGLALAVQGIQARVEILED